MIDLKKKLIEFDWFIELKSAKCIEFHFGLFLNKKKLLDDVFFVEYWKISFTTYYIASIIHDQNNLNSLEYLSLIIAKNGTFGFKKFIAGTAAISD